MTFELTKIYSRRRTTCRTTRLHTTTTRHDPLALLPLFQIDLSRQLDQTSSLHLTYGTESHHTSTNTFNTYPKSRILSLAPRHIHTPRPKRTYCKDPRTMNHRKTILEPLILKMLRLTCPSDWPHIHVLLYVFCVDDENGQAKTVRIQNLCAHPALLLAAPGHARKQSHGAFTPRSVRTRVSATTSDYRVPQQLGPLSLSLPPPGFLSAACLHVTTPQIAQHTFVDKPIPERACHPKHEFSEGHCRRLRCSSPNRITRSNGSHVRAPLILLPPEAGQQLDTASRAEFLILHFKA